MRSTFYTERPDKICPNVNQDLYLDHNQNAVVKIDDNTSGRIEVRRGVRQGCGLSEMLFNIYAEKSMKVAVEDEAI